jgi:hypothetical protein
MPFPLALIAFALAIQPASPAAPSLATVEHLGIAAPAGMVPRTKVEGARRSTDWFAAGETFDDARRLVTVLDLAGRGGPTAPAELIRGLATCFRPCPTQLVSPLDATPFAGRPAARVRIDTPPNPRTGKPMTIFALAVSGERDLHLIAVAIRGPVSPADEAFAQAVLRSATWCPAGSTDGVCASN